MKRAAAGQLPLLGAIKKLMAEVMEPPSFDDGGDTDDLLAAEAALLTNLKKAALFCSGAATQKYMQALQDQQEIMGDLADMTMQVFALESALLRARKLSSQSQKSQTQTAHAMVKLFAADALAVVEKAARRVLAAVAEGDMLRTQLAILRRLLKHTPEDTIALSRMVAQRQFDAGGYRV
jgi:butyryl-CoA dehydrogenase